MWSGWEWPYSNVRGKTHKRTNKCNIFLLLTFIQAVLCSSFQLSIAVLTRPADSMWQLVISRQCTSKHDLFFRLPRFLYQAPAGLCHVRWLSRRPHVYKKVTNFCGGVRVEGREVQLICANETLLSVSGLHHWTKWKLECAAYVQCLCCCAVWL